MDDILIYEDITGGRHRVINPNLVSEADAMVSALARDLCDTPEVGSVTLIRDARLPVNTLHPLTRIVSVRADHDDVNKILSRELKLTNAFWPVAPETDGCLERICSMGESYPCRLLNSSASAVCLTASKYETSRVLSDAGVPCVLTWKTLPKDLPTNINQHYVIKPDDGVGCAAVRRVTDLSLVRAALRQGMVAQPYMEGEHLSISLACHKGKCDLLAVNAQVITWRDGYGYLDACVVGTSSVDVNRLHDLGNAITATMPSLSGYVGVDLIAKQNETAREPAQLIVMEINPRLTTAYVGIRSAYGYNPARHIHRLLHGKRVSVGAMAGEFAFTAPKPVMVRAA